MYLGSMQRHPSLNIVVLFSFSVSNRSVVILKLFNVSYILLYLGQFDFHSVMVGCASTLNHEYLTFI